MSSPLVRASVLVLLAAGLAGATAAGCGNSNKALPGPLADSGTSDAPSHDGATSDSPTGDGSSSGGDAGDGGCVFETLVTNMAASTPTPTTPATCDTPLCGCTDNGQLITTVPGSF
jgi:ABC-type phosphate transport system substrate-binding protein